MNVFGAFTFGGLIKTFLPGFVWLVAVVIACLQWPAVGTFIDKHESLVAVLSIPASILLGLLSNILVFMGVNDLFVRNPVRSNNKPLFELYDALCVQMTSKCWASIDCPHPGMENVFNQKIDAELLMLHKVGVSTLAYVREQYWFHLEFQLNLLLSCIGMTVASCSYLYKTGALTGLAVALIAIAVVVLFAWLLVSAARKNY